MRVIYFILIVTLFSNKNLLFGSVRGAEESIELGYSFNITNGSEGILPGNLNRFAQAPIITFSKTDVNCFGALSGAIYLTITGETGLTSYVWADNPAITTKDRTGLAAGTYSVTVTDTNGSTIQTVTITQPAAALTAAVASQTNVLCFGNATGVINVAGANGTPPYEYSLNGGTYQSSGTFSSLVAGAYTVTIRDAGGCTVSQNATITQPAAALTAAVAAQTNVLCFGNATGVITVAAANGTPPYEYSLNGGTYQSSGTFSSLTAGAYTVTIRDAGGCTVSQNATITQPAAALTFNSPLITNVSCSGKNDGKVEINVSGGTGITNYTINPNIGNQSSTGIFNSLTAQSYIITGTDQNGCTQTVSVTVGTIPDITPPVISGCPVDITINTGASGTLCSQTATWTEPTATDNCIGSISYSTRSHTPGSAFPVGVTTVTYTFKDASGNTSTCAFTVTVTDNTPPGFTSPNDITIYSDNTGNYNASPAITGQPLNLVDNCSLGAIQAIPSDGVRTFGSCTGTSSFIRTWSLTDAHNNTTTHTQTITITDNLSPVLTIPPNAFIECTASILPANTGEATATDNGGSAPTITYTDVTVNGNCPGRSTITRTWTARDCSGNTVSRNQTINIQDTQPPVISCVSFSVANPNMIPPSDSNLNISATENCGGTIEFILISEEYAGLSGTAGFCPTSVTRKYVARDQCGNTSAPCTQVITVLDRGACDICQSTVPFFPVILTGSPDSLWTSPSVKRQDLCCGAIGPPPPRCVSFNVYLDKDAVGLVFRIKSGAIPPGALYYQVDCGPKTMVGEVLCLVGGRFYTLTFCEPGNNPNVYEIQSISGLTSASGITTRQDAKCADTLFVRGADISTIKWTVKSPNDQTLLRYLSCTTCDAPIFTPDLQTPPDIIFEVCATLFGSNKCNNVPIVDCKEVRVVTLPAIKLALDVDMNNICKNNIPIIDAIPSPANQNYVFQWYNGPDGTGDLKSTESSWKPTGEGTFSVMVSEVLSGIKCNTAIQNFIIKFDTIGPSIIAPPAPLIVQCNDPNAPQQIANWLTSAKASYNLPDGTLVTSQPTNNFNGITMACNQTLTVTFTAKDQCDNISTTTSTITVIDTQSPVISYCPVDVSRDADVGTCFATGVQLGTPVATDNCVSPVITNDAPSQFAIGTTVVTWSATDACGNKTSCTQNVTINDLLPALSCPPSLVVKSDFNKPQATKVNIGTPLYSDNCPGLTLTWVSSDPTPGASGLTGVNIDTVSTYNVGVTTITYTLTDAHNHKVNCSYTVTVLPKPKIICAPDTVRNNDPGLCSAVLNPGVATLDSGAEPISWSWQMTGATTASGTGKPINPIPYPFNVGLTSITWTASNASGDDSCIQRVTVIDNEPPTYNAAPQTFCVEKIHLAEFYLPTTNITPVHPDFFTFKTGDTALDITEIKDNCCSVQNMVINWRIDFTDTPNQTPPPSTTTRAPITETGQPSIHTTDILIPGDGVNFADIVHKITYWVVDCNGNKSIEKTVNITIKPRPDLR